GPAISFGSTNGYLAQIQANADSVDGELYFRHKTPNVTRPWKAIAFKDWVSNYHVTTNTEQVISGKKIYSTDQYYNNNIGIV
ncbi:hypothetical protein, partial [Vibrio sinaloensis]|uniref:hypothetical protein n=1 Tax=Photobacterium sp. (strain ATCC 43367) TaxID=379097 RepID=UPI0022AEB15E